MLSSTDRPHAVVNTTRAADAISFRSSTVSEPLYPRRPWMIYHDTISIVSMRGTALGLTHLEAFAPSQNEIAQRHTDIVVDNLAVALGSIVVPENLHGTNDLHTRRVRRHNDHTLLVVLVRVVRVALAEHEVYRTPWVTGTADPPARRVEQRSDSQRGRLYHLCPLITISLPSWRIEVRMFVASEDETARI